MVQEGENSGTDIDDAMQGCPADWQALLSGAPRAPTSVVRANSSVEEIKCLFVPTQVSADTDLQRYEGFRVRTKPCNFTASVVVAPHYLGDDLSRKWLTPYQEPPRNKVVRKQCRTAVFDGVLNVLRTCRDSELRSIMAHGEGAVIVAAALDQEVRDRAFEERRVPENERIELHSVLLDCSMSFFSLPTGILCARIWEC